MSFNNIGYWQVGLGATNDFTTFIFTGGNASSINNIIRATNNLDKATNGFMIFSNYYMMGRYGSGANGTK